MLTPETFSQPDVLLSLPHKGRTSRIGDVVRCLQIHVRLQLDTVLIRLSGILGKQYSMNIVCLISVRSYSNVDLLIARCWGINRIGLLLKCELSRPTYFRAVISRRPILYRMLPMIGKSSTKVLPFTLTSPRLRSMFFTWSGDRPVALCKDVAMRDMNLRTCSTAISHVQS